MKNYYYLKRFTLLLPLLLHTLFGLAQYERYVEPNQIQSTADEIELLFGDMINVSNADLVLSLQNMLSDFDPSATLMPPNPSVTSVQNQVIEFTWPAIQGANNYGLSSFHLENGQYADYVFPVTVNSYPVPIAYGLHLFASKTFDAVGITKGVNIFIVDADIDLRIVKDGPCNCGNDSTPSWGSLGEDALEGYLLALDIETEFDLVFGEMEVVPDGIYAGDADVLIIHGSKTDTGEIEMVNKPDCSNDGIAEWGLEVFEKGSSSVALTITWDVDLVGTMNMFAGTCRRKKMTRSSASNGQGKESNTSKNTLWPNPVNDELNIVNSNGIKAIRIISMNGKVMIDYQVGIMDRLDLKIPMIGLPTGIYFVELISSGTIERKSMIKN